MVGEPDCDSQMLFKSSQKGVCMRRHASDPNYYYFAHTRPPSCVTEDAATAEGPRTTLGMYGLEAPQPKEVG
jgi:hypothetical protein